MSRPTLRKVGAALVTFVLTATVPVFAQSDVTQPGDPVIASSVNSPGSEGVANAIDNTQAKYLNFDSAQNGDSGFIVSPGVGITRVTGMTIQAANDEPVRDPRIVRLEGSNDPTVTGFNTGTWELITELSNIPDFTARFQRQTFTFTNNKGFRHYRWTVLETATANGCCMQVAEIELLGEVVPGDVTVPGDPAIASSVNSPGSEGVANAIDNTQAKYLNFDSAQDGDSGLIVSPGVGRTVVTGLAIQSANDEPVRDPKRVRVEGSNDAAITAFNAGTWETITELQDI